MSNEEYKELMQTLLTSDGKGREKKEKALTSLLNEAFRKGIYHMAEALEEDDDCL